MTLITCLMPSLFIIHLFLFHLFNCYSENGLLAKRSAKLGALKSSTYRLPTSLSTLSKLVWGFRRTILQRHVLIWFLNAKRGNSARMPRCLSDGIRSRPRPNTSAAIPDWVIATSGSLWRAIERVV